MNLSNVQFQLHFRCSSGNGSDLADYCCYLSRHLFGADVLDKIIKRFIRRWFGGVFANANTGAGKLLEHGMVAGNPLRKKRRADEWYGKAKLLDPAGS